MQVSVENTGKLERKLTVSVPADRLEGTIKSRLRELSQNVRIKGFRPGKVPANIIEQRYGRQVRSDALNEVIRESFAEAVQKENLRPAVQPSIETTGQAADGEFRYVATFEVMPEIGTIDVSGLKVVKPVAEVTDADIDRMIETLRLQRRTWNNVERAAKDGDLVMFESSSVVGDTRVPAEGVERSGTIIGSNAVLPELEQNLVGLVTGEEREFEVTFPADYRVAELAGKTAKVQVKAARVSEASIPELDDTFMQQFGITDGGLERFRKEVRANLERELKAALMQRLKNDVVEKLVDAHSTLDFPARMVDAEARGLVRQAEQQAQQQNQPAPQISADSVRPVAQKRVAAAVLLGELARQNNIRLDQGRMQDMLATIASTYEEPEQVVELYKNDPQLMDGLRSRVVEDQVIDWIADHAEADTRTLSFDEVMRPGAAG